MYNLLTVADREFDSKYNLMLISRVLKIIYWSFFCKTEFGSHLLSKITHVVDYDNH